MLAWIDIESTSLVPAECGILEVAVIVTDDQLCEVDRFHRVVYWTDSEKLAHLGPDSSEEDLLCAGTAIDLVVIQMHSRNGLWKESAGSPHSLAAVDRHLSEFLSRASRGEDGARALVAGSSIWFDRSLMAVSLPESLRELHYRSVDVTTLHELGRRLWPWLYDRGPSKRELHRAVPDIEDSLGLCRYYGAQIREMCRVSERLETRIQQLMDLGQGGHARALRDLLEGGASL